MNEGTIVRDKKLPWVYFFTYTTQNIGQALCMTYLIVYMTDVLLIAPAAMAAIMLIARIFDLGTALIAGAVIQKSNMKLGQFRSWLAIAGPLLTIGSIMCFVNPAIGVGGKAIIIGIGYVIFGASQNFLMVAHNSLMAKAAGADIKYRITITGRIMQGMNAGLIISSMAALPLILWFQGMGTNGYLVVAVIFGILALIGQFTLFAATKKYDPYDPNLKKVEGSSQNVKTTQMIGTTFQNGQFWIVFLSDILRNTATFTLQAVTAYYFIYVVGNYGMMAVAMTIQSLAGLLGSFIAPYISMRIGKKNSAILSGISGIVLVLMGMTAGSNYIIFIVCCSITNILFALVGSVGVNLYLDSAEYQFNKTGKDSRTFVMSMYSVPIKIGIAISAVAAAFLLEATGYNAALEAVDNLSLMALLVGMIPGVLYILSGLLMIPFKINEKMSREFAAENEKKMAALRMAQESQ